MNKSIFVKCRLISYNSRTNGAAAFPFHCWLSFYLNYLTSFVFLWFLSISFAIFLFLLFNIYYFLSFNFLQHFSTNFDIFRLFSFPMTPFNTFMSIFYFLSLLFHSSFIFSSYNFYCSLFIANFYKCLWISVTFMSFVT